MTNEIFKSVYQDGRFINLEALARKLQLSIMEKGGKLPENDDEILTVLGAWDESAHETDSMDTERLGQFIEEFIDEWHQANGEKKPEDPQEPGEVKE